MGLELGWGPQGLSGRQFNALCPECHTSNTAPCSPTVSEPQAAHSPLEKPPSTAILCNTCGNVCKGEVLRVQNKYFHIKCFVCKGECPRPLFSVPAVTGERSILTACSMI